MTLSGNIGGNIIKRSLNIPKSCTLKFLCCMDSCGWPKWKIQVPTSSERICNTGIVCFMFTLYAGSFYCSHDIGLHMLPITGSLAVQCTSNGIPNTVNLCNSTSRGVAISDILLLRGDSGIYPPGRIFWPRQGPPATAHQFNAKVTFVFCPLIIWQLIWVFDLHYKDCS